MTKRTNRLRRQAGYEEDTPLCANCKFFRRPQTITKNGGKFYQQGHCMMHDFHAKSNAVCDTWTGKNGDVLDNS